MRCENEYCIYAKEQACSLREISLDNLGICREMIFVSFDAAFLAKAREERLARIERPQA